MKKKTIRLIHQLARSGGTVISKCIGCMDEVILLSEIHPLGTRYFNPLMQAKTWFGLFEEGELKNFSEPIKTFNDMIRIINDRVEQRDKKLVIRGWNHLDFFPSKFVPDYNYNLKLLDDLRHEFNISCRHARMFSWMSTTFRETR